MHNVSKIRSQGVPLRLAGRRSAQNWSVKLELLIGLTGQPTRTPLSGVAHFQIFEPHLDELLVVHRPGLILGKEGHGPRNASALFKDLDRFTPRLALAVVDLAQIKHLTLYDPAPGHAPVFHQRPVAVLLA